MYFDTSVLVAASLQAHKHHTPCLKLLNTAIEDNAFIISTHSLAELYSVFTKIPVPYKLSPKNALLLVENLVNQTQKIINLDHRDYKSALERVAKLSLTSGVIFDSLHVEAALKAQVDTISTLNEKDFLRLTQDITIKVVAPLN